MAKNTENYSPSILHKTLIKKAPLSLAFKGGDFKAWQRKLRKKLLGLIGGIEKKRVPLRVRSLWKREHKLGTIEKIVFTSEALVDVPAYVSLPKGISAPYQFFICLQGHSTGMHNSIGLDLETNTKKIKIDGDRDFAIGCLERGIASLCIEQRSFGERVEKVQDYTSSWICDDAAMQALLVGKTLIGERVFDVDRAIDYLEQRGDVDMKTLGVMGNSGGGTVSLFSAALLPRLKLAMPSCYFCTFAASIGAMHHCTCNYIPGIMNYAEMSDLMGLFAPRPVVIVAGKDDDIFPLSAVRTAFKKLKAIYKAAGAEENCKLVIGKGGHRFYADQGWKAMQKYMK